MWILILVWMILLIGLSVSPLSFKLKLHTVGPYHDFGHYIVYLLTAILICQVAKRFGGRVAGFFFALALALGQEWLENQMYHAGYEWKDVATDMAGTLSGFALVTLMTVLFQDSATSRHAK
jgi:hypothetical protein